MLAATEAITIEPRFARECDVNFSKTFDLPDGPIIESARPSVTIKSDADEETPERVTKFAEEHCPAMYSLTNRITVETELSVE